MKYNYLNKHDRMLAYSIFDIYVKDACARRIVKHVFGSHIAGADVTRPSNAFFRGKFGWSDKTVRNKLCEAKRSGFIIVGGRGDNRFMKIDDAFLESKIDEFLSPTKSPLKSPAKSPTKISSGDKIGDFNGDTTGDSNGDKMAQNNRYGMSPICNSNSNSIFSADAEQPHKNENQNEKNDGLHLEETRGEATSNLGEPLAPAPSPFGAPTKSENLELADKTRRQAYGRANSLLKKLKPKFGDFKITNKLQHNAKNMIEIFGEDTILQSVDKYLKANWIDSKNIYGFLSEQTIGNLVSVVNEYENVKEWRLPWQREVDDKLIAQGKRPNYMDKPLMKKYGLYEKFYDENDKIREEYKR